MTLLQRTDGDDADSGVSYLDLVSFIKSGCADITTNLEELFRRVLFSVCVSITDDHLRNHRFIYLETGWTLLPAFNTNKNKNKTKIELKLNIDEDDNSLDISLVMNTPYYLLSDKGAAEIKDEVIKAVSSWRKVATEHKVSPSKLNEK